MASVPSLPLPVESTTVNNGVLHGGNRQIQLPFFTYRPRKSPSYACFSVSTFGGSKGVEESSDRRRVWRIQRPIAAGKGSVEGEDSNESEDVTQATIEKGKKVLAVQKNLLQQIAERRKLVSSIKSSVIDSEDIGVPHNASKRSTGGDNADVEDYTSGSLSRKYDYSTEDEEPETLPESSRRGFRDDEKESGKSVLVAKSSTGVDSSNQLQKRTPETVRSEELPSFLSKSFGSSTLKSEKPENLRESISQEVNGVANVLMEEDVKPPPLAGSNVMNVILVAAECAPWSKTGGLGDVAGALPKALARRGHRVMVTCFSNFFSVEDVECSSQIQILVVAGFG